MNVVTAVKQHLYDMFLAVPIHVYISDICGQLIAMFLTIGY